MYLSSEEYFDFCQYYQKSFKEDLNQLFKSYCTISKNDIVFLGFNKDNLVHIDTIIMGIHIKQIKFPSEKDITKFALAIWSIAVSDIIVYSLYHCYSQLWENMTRYPKFTGWNYCATEPSHIFDIIEKVYPNFDFYNQISILIKKIKNDLVEELSCDIINILNLDIKEKEKIKKFASSWLIGEKCRNNTYAEGEYYNLDCFLY